MSNPSIERVRDLIAQGTITRSGLARAAGLHANTLRDCTEPDWNPTHDTLRKLDRYLDENDGRPVLVSIEEIIDEARNGRMYILVDDEDRENEGDLIIPAQMVTPDAVNFMAMHGRGLICLALSSERCDDLNLEPMTRHNRTPLGTAFTVSIEAREGVETGISAADRAHTIRVAVDGASTAADLVSPGHVFPLRARKGGVLVRAGHTEAAVDISRLAGLNPSGVICEIMRDDGKMARLDDLLLFARQHGLKVGTIRDLIAYRRQHDRVIVQKAAMQFNSRWGGEWQARVFTNKIDNDEMLALVKGDISSDTPTLVRMHALSIFADVFGEDSDRADLLQRSMTMIAEEGAGAIVLINRPKRDYLSGIIAARGGNVPRTADNEELRDYGLGAQVLAELGVQDMVLLTNTHHSLIALAGYGLNIVEERAIV